MFYILCDTYILFQQPLDEDDASSIEGYYVGYKLSSSSDPYTFIPVEAVQNKAIQHYEITNLNRYTGYSFIIQAFNKRGAGPPSEAISARTLEFGELNIDNIPE